MPYIKDEERLWRTIVEIETNKQRAKRHNRQIEIMKIIIPDKESFK